MALQTRSQDHKTKQNRHSLIISAVIGVTVYIGLLLGLECISRTAWFNNAIPIRSLGIYHNQFEIKWFKLQDYVRKNGGVDVLLLGSSMVNTGIDPEIFSSTYEELTGTNLRVFNFGVEGLTVAPNSVVARILVEKYHPASIIFETEMRDYVAANGLEVEKQLLSDEWFLGQNAGEIGMRGWLKTHSTAAQRLLPFRNWSRADFPDTFIMSIRRFGDTSDSGYEADLNIGKDVEKHPDPNDPAEAVNFALFKDFTISPERLQDLRHIIELGDGTSPVIVTEMPLYPTYFDYFGGELVHQQYLDSLGTFVDEQGGVFLPALDWRLIPLQDRVDNHHLNITGAPLYSALLAEQIVDAGILLQPAVLSGGER